MKTQRERCGRKNDATKGSRDRPMPKSLRKSEKRWEARFGPRASAAALIRLLRTSPEVLERFGIVDDGRPDSEWFHRYPVEALRAAVAVVRRPPISPHGGTAFVVRRVGGEVVERYFDRVAAVIACGVKNHVAADADEVCVVEEVAFELRPFA